MFRTQTIIIKYCTNKGICEKEIDLMVDKTCINEYDMMEEFYNVLSTTAYALTELKWFYILNTDTQYDMDIKFKDEAYYKLYEMVVLKNKMSILELEVVNTYKEYMETKTHYWNLRNKTDNKE